MSKSVSRNFLCSQHATVFATVRLNHPSKQKACQIEYDCWSSRKMSNYDVTKVGLIISLISKVWEWFRKGVKHCKPFLATIRKNRDMGLCTPRTIIFLQETITLIFFFILLQSMSLFSGNINLLKTPQIVFMLGFLFFDSKKGAHQYWWDPAQKRLFQQN